LKYRPPGRHLKHRPPPAAASRPAVVRRSATVPSRTRSMHPLAPAITGERSALVSCPRCDAPCRPAPPMLSPPHDRRGRRLAGTIVVCCHPSSGPLSVARICYTPWLAPERSAAACQPGLGRMAAARDARGRRQGLDRLISLGSVVMFCQSAIRMWLILY